MMNNFSSEFSRPFVFKLPVGSSEADTIDLKWLGEEFKRISELFNQFTEDYKELSQNQNHSTALLKAQVRVIEALAFYQIALLEQQGKRQGHIQTESELQEMMNQLDHFMKTFRENK